MSRSIKRMQAKRAAGNGGFTLIELLVVIIILGILAAVVVFSIQGVNDRGEDAAAAIDARTLRTAQEAYRAQNPGFGTEADLVAGGFLSDGSSLHDIVLSGDSYYITCDPNEPTCGQNGTTPDGNFPGAEGASPTGMWKRTGDLQEGVRESVSPQMVTLANGKVLMWATPPSAPPSSPGVWTPGPIQMFDPAGGTWSSVPAPPNPAPEHPDWNPLRSASLLHIAGSAAECGTSCGKVLVGAGVGANEPPGFLNAKYYLFDPVAFDNGEAPSQIWTRLADPTMPDSGFAVQPSASRFVQLDCSQASAPGSDCGKILFTGGTDTRATVGGRPAGVTDTQVVVWDPLVGPGTASAWSTRTSPTRIVNDGSRSAGDPVITSTLAQFTAADVNAGISGGGLTNGTVITGLVGPAPTTQVTVTPVPTSAGSGLTWTIGVNMTANGLTALPGGRALATGVGSATYDPVAQSWLTASNTPPLFTYTCPPSATVRRHLPGAATILSDGTLLSVSTATSCNTSAGVNNLAPNSGNANSLIFDPAAAGGAGAWSLASGFCPCSGGIPSVVSLDAAHGNDVLLVYGGLVVNRTVGSAIFDGSTWTTVASEFSPRKAFPDGTSAVTPGDAPITTVLLTGQVLMATGTECTVPPFGTSCFPPMTPLSDTWLFTPPVG